MTEFDPRYDLVVIGSEPTPGAVPPTDRVDDGDFAGTVDRILKGIALAPPETTELLTWPAVPADAARRQLVERAAIHAARLGVDVALCLVRFVDAPVSHPRGIASSMYARLSRVTLRIDVPVEELAAVVLHEFQHVGDFVSGVMADLSLVERERRARYFSWNALTTWEGE